MERSNKRSKKQKIVKKPVIRMLGPADPTLGEEPKVMARFTLCPEIQKDVEHVGKGYEKLQRLMVKVRQWRELQGDEPYEQSDEEEEQVTNKKRQRRVRVSGKEKAARTEDLDNYYRMLDLEETSYESGEKEIKKAYMMCAITFHPDKMGEDASERDQEVWLAIQTAYETLLDPVRRRKYDSTLPFDDDVPEEKDVTDVNFYDLYDEVFRNNARFSKKKPVPSIGFDDDEMKDVYAFYKFWNNFESWREFAQFEEHKLEEASNRWEMRKNATENKKQSEKYFREEKRRLNDLVDLAYKLDPRMKRERQLELEEKERKKIEKRAGKEAERLQLLEAQKALNAKEADEAAEKAARDEEASNAIKAEQKRRREQLKKLIVLCETHFAGTNYDKFFLNEFAKRADGHEIIDKAVVLVEEKKFDSIDEFEELMIKGDKLEEARKARMLCHREEAKVSVSVAKTDDWSPEEMSSLAKACEKYPGGTSGRWKSVAKFVGTRSMKEVTAKAKDLASMQGANKTAEKAPVQNPLEWNVEQQKQLEEGMRQFTASMPVKERWLKISELVDGKEPKQCFERFKEIVSKIKTKGKK